MLWHFGPFTLSKYSVIRSPNETIFHGSEAMKSCKESNQNNIKCFDFGLFSRYSSITLNHRHRI